MIKNLLRRLTPPVLLDAFHLLKKLLRRKAVQDSLFDGDGSSFKKLAADCRVYGEYGCGQSTQWVLSNAVAQIYSVDSSRAWVDKVESQAAGNERLKIRWIDMGELGDWGRPLNYGKRENFRVYMDWIWQQSPPPDLILVDGRFRVACFLTSLLRAKPGSSIVFDDYANRPHYHLVEEFVPKQALSGRQAIFVVPPLSEPQRQAIEDVLEKFRYVMD